MLSVHAHSFRHKSRLAISLSWVAGYTNVILLILTGQTVSHMTGNSTRFGNAAGNFLLQKPGAGTDLVYFGFLIAMFFFGAVVSGMLTESARSGERGSKYAQPITLQAILLSGLVVVMLIRPELAHGTDGHRSALYALTGVAAFAMGLQNATITRISGAVVRTTHLTGVITDLGLEMVLLWNWYREKSASGRARRYRRMWLMSRRQSHVLRVLLLSSILGSFLFGVIAGTILFEKTGTAALLAPVLFLAFIVLRDYFKDYSRDYFKPN